MFLTVFVFSSFSLTAGFPASNHQKNTANHVTYRAENHEWAHMAFDMLQKLNCDNTLLTTIEDCRKLLSIPKSNMNIYSAGPMREEKLQAVLPDGALSHNAGHDAVLVLDPYPTANLGHLLIVFFVDMNADQEKCEFNRGLYRKGDCMSIATRKRCHNIIRMPTQWKQNHLNEQARHKHCEVDIFPLVHELGEHTSQKKQALRCREVPGFEVCPELRPRNETEYLACDPMKINSPNCRFSMDLRCRLFEMCDHAVLISGGWDRLSERRDQIKNLHHMHNMLKHNGFPEENIKTFYTNGYSEKDEGFDVRPATDKLPIRFLLRKLCESKNCADSLVIYLNSVTRNDGSFYLWDADGNGKAESDEIYSIQEFLHDIQNCAAQQVFIIADQNYAGQLIHSLEASRKHRNVMAFASGQEHEYSSHGFFTRFWSLFLRTSGSRNSCLPPMFKEVKGRMELSKPIMYDGSNGTMSTTIFGAPCNIRPLYSESELRKEFFGCQNLPTAVWLRGKPTRNPDLEDEDYTSLEA